MIKITKDKIEIKDLLIKPLKKEEYLYEVDKDLPFKVEFERNFIIGEIRFFKKLN